MIKNVGKVQSIQDSGRVLVHVAEVVPDSVARLPGPAGGVQASRRLRTCSGCAAQAHPPDHKGPAKILH
eukprot:SAG25_NODE_7737_length_463_cov_0.703297_1_plen_68_part_10